MSVSKPDQADAPTRLGRLWRELTVQFHQPLAECAHTILLLQVVAQLLDSTRRSGATTFSLPGRASVAIALMRGAV